MVGPAHLVQSDTDEEEDIVDVPNNDGEENVDDGDEDENQDAADEDEQDQITDESSGELGDEDEENGIQLQKMQTTRSTIK